MAQADDRVEWRILPWAGTVEQVRRAAQQCEAKVAVAASFPEGYDPEAAGRRFDGKKHEEWRNAERAREVVVRIAERGGYSRKLTSLEDLDELSGDWLNRIADIDIDIGGGGYSSPSAGISVSKDRGLSIRLVGPDRTWTAGLRHELDEMLKPPGKLRPLPLSEGAYVGLAILAFAAIYFGLLFYLDSQTDWSDAAGVGVPLGVAAFAAVTIAVVGIRLPALELLSPGDKPAYERWRRRILGAAGAVVLSIVASFLAGLVGG